MNNYSWWGGRIWKSSWPVAQSGHWHEYIRSGYDEAAVAPWTAEAPRRRTICACGRTQGWSFYLQRCTGSSQIGQVLVQSHMNHHSFNSCAFPWFHVTRICNRTVKCVSCCQDNNHCILLWSILLVPCNLPCNDARFHSTESGWCPWSVYLIIQPNIMRAYIYMYINTMTDLTCDHQFHSSLGSVKSVEEYTRDRQTALQKLLQVCTYLHGHPEMKTPQVVWPPMPQYLDQDSLLKRTTSEIRTLPQRGSAPHFSKGTHATCTYEVVAVGSIRMQEVLLKPCTCVSLLLTPAQAMCLTLSYECM